MSNDASERARQEQLARQGQRTGDYRNQNEHLKMESEKREREANERAWNNMLSSSSNFSSSKERSGDYTNRGGGGGCFAEGSLVMSENGWRPIESIQVGDSVMAVDPRSGESAMHAVIQRHMQHGAQTWEVRLSGGTAPISTTKHHRFLTDKGWKPARKLKQSNRIVMEDGSFREVLSSLPSQRTETVYNLVTEGCFTYVVAGCVVDSLGFFRAFKLIWYRHNNCVPVGSPIANRV